MKNGVLYIIILFALAGFANVPAKSSVSHGQNISTVNVGAVGKVRQPSSGGNALERAGGLVSRPASEQAYKIVNAQQVVREEIVRGVADELADRLQLPVKFLSAGECKGEDIKGPALVLTMKREYESLTVSPVKGMAWVGMHALMADKPPAERLELRVRKEMWRGFVYSLGGGNSTFPHCVMKPVTTLFDLDAIEAQSACPEAFNAVLAGADKFGISGVRTTTYLRACREGWAPEPVNDIQRRIWNEVKNPASRWEKDFDPKGK